MKIAIVHDFLKEYGSPRALTCCRGFYPRVRRDQLRSNNKKIRTNK